MLAVGKNVTGFRITLRTQAVDTRSIRNINDFIGFHHIQADTANTGVCFIVGVSITAIVSLVGERQVRVVQVAVRVATQTAVLQEFTGFFGNISVEDFQALIGTTPTGSAVHIEYRDTHQFAHRRQTDQAHFA